MHFPVTGGGQKLRTGSLVLPVADNILSDKCIVVVFSCSGMSATYLNTKGPTNFRS